MPSANASAELLAIWHTYRYPIIFSAAALVALVRLTIIARSRRSRISHSPLIASLKLESKDRPIVILEKDAPPSVLDDGHLEELPATQPLQTFRVTGPKRVTGGKAPKKALRRHFSFDSEEDSIRLLIFFSSLGGTTEATARALHKEMAHWTEEQGTTRLLQPELHDLSEEDHDDFFISPPKADRNVKFFYLLLLPSYNIDTQLDTFIEHLKETHHDFRIDTAPLSSILGYSVFGFGDKEGWPTEEEGFCSQAKEVDRWMAKLTGRKRAFPLGMEDTKSDAKARLKEWTRGVQDVVRDVAAGKGLGEGVTGSGDPAESDEDSTEEEGVVTNGFARRRKKSKFLEDLEDIGDTVQREAVVPPAIDFTAYKPSTKPVVAAKEMVPKASPTYTALTKQGYTIVGSHSGVKICRWTKSALRGRGSCYKFSFYGIASHQCMETTPSLSCSNKCVFCWRHGTNPVGTTWRWQVDPPEEIYKGVTEGHYKKIKMMKGVPGVRAERFQEAMRIRHCALSLVGEPIFYPHINEFTAMLHKEHISSFLVCNAQHPDQLAALKPVTQLYVSIDASNKESLRKIDRPLHRDFWERFNRCLDILREKRFKQRTVFRLTLVKGFNIDEEVSGYADLVEKALPCFVEVKGVTYCGTSTSSAAGLTMQNVPFYEEVSAFVVALNDELQRRGLGYGIAAEHSHSCCVLIASERFRKAGKWHTLIGYEKFFKCLESGQEFRPEDYMGEPTPEWALWGRGGFDPRDERVDRKGRKKVIEI